MSMEAPKSPIDNAMDYIKSLKLKPEQTQELIMRLQKSIAEEPSKVPDLNLKAEKNLETEENSVEVFKKELENLDKLLDSIRNNFWWSGNKFGELKGAFFRFLREELEGNKLKIFLKKINELNSSEEIENFLREKQLNITSLFSEIFRLHQFTKVEPFQIEFEKIKFPFKELDENLELIRKVLKESWDLEFIVPNIYKDNIKNNMEKYERERNSSHILARGIVPMDELEKDIDAGIIYDFDVIGLKSEKLNLNTKAKVYCHSKM